MTSITSNDEESVTSSSDVHRKKALFPVPATDLGISMCSNELQLEKQLCPIYVTDSGITTSFKFLHPQKAKLSILVTDEGITTFSNETQFSNARHGIVSIVN